MIGIRSPLDTTAEKPVAGHGRANALGWRVTLVCTLFWLFGLIQGFEAALPLLFVLGLAMSIKGLTDPVIGLVGVGILATIDAPARVYMLHGGIFRWNTFNYWLLIVIILYVPFLLRLHSIQIRLLELFAVLLLLQLAVTPDLINGAQHILSLVSVFGILIYFVRALHADGSVLETVGLVNGAVAAGGGLVFFVQHEHLPYINPNAFSHFPTVGLFSAVLALSLKARDETDRPVWYHYALVAINYAWVFLSGSRGGLLIASIAVVTLLIGQNSLHMRRLGRNITMLAVGTLVFLGLMSQFSGLQKNTIERVERTFDTSLTLKSRTSGRSDLARGGIEIFRQNPLGVGTGGYTQAWTSLNADELGLLVSTERQLAAHSGWIKVLAENGFLGFGLLGLFVFSFMISGWQQRKQGLFLLGILITSLIAIALISTEFQSKLIWFASAAGIALLHRQEMISDWQGTLRREPVELFRTPRLK